MAGSASNPIATTLKRATFVALGLVVLVTIYVHERYVLNPFDPLWTRFKPFRWWLLPHVLTGIVALCLGPLQFSTTLRRKYLTFHRWTGRVYAASAIVSAILSLYIVLTFEEPFNRWVMGAMGGVWLAATAFAWLAALSGNLTAHKLWVSRSYCLTLTFVATRFIPDVLLPGLDYYNMTSLYWMLIIISLVLPDIVVFARALWPFKR